MRQGWWSSRSVMLACLAVSLAGAVVLGLDAGRASSARMAVPPAVVVRGPQPPGVPSRSAGGRGGAGSVREVTPFRPVENLEPEQRRALGVQTAGAPGASTDTGAAARRAGSSRAPAHGSATQGVTSDR